MTIIEEVKDTCENLKVEYSTKIIATVDFLLEMIDPYTGEVRFVTNARRGYIRLEGTSYRINNKNKEVDYIEFYSDPYLIKTVNLKDVWFLFEKKIEEKLRDLDTEWTNISRLPKTIKIN